MVLGLGVNASRLGCRFGSGPMGWSAGVLGVRVKARKQGLQKLSHSGDRECLARTERGARLDLVVQSVRVRVSGRSFIACTTVQHHGVEKRISIESRLLILHCFPMLRP